MQRENRYCVFTHTDAEKYLNALERHEIYRLAGKIAEGRIADGKRDKKFVCVADDWPEYEYVWKMIEERVDGTASSVHDELHMLKTMIEELRNLQQMWEKALDSIPDEHKREGGENEST